MKKIKLFLLIITAGLLSSCAGIRYFTIETHEPAQVTLPDNINSILIVNNVVQQPDEIGHNIKKIGSKDFERTNANADSAAIYYTEALAQFLNEENFYDSVMLYDKPLRNDKDFWKQRPIFPEKMNQLRDQSGADAILSLDKLIVQTNRDDQFIQQGYTYGKMKGLIQSVIHVYLPTMDGKLPLVQFNDSLTWEGFDIQDSYAYADFLLPSREEAIKQLAVYAAEKMTYVFSPHWVLQDRWYYTLPNTPMRQGEVYAKDNKWMEAIERWEFFYNMEKNENKKAKAANNIALAYEMLDDMDNASKWINISENLFKQSTSQNSFDRKRVTLYKTEIERRRDNSNKLNMQLP
jgi:tetratricopeptide (TPR) repeat protein